MCFGRTETNGIVVSESLRLVRLLGYRGLASIEFKRRASDNRYYFIEMNARLPRYCGLLADAGVNLPHLGYLDLTAADRRSDPSLQQHDNVYWLAVGEDFLSVRQSREPRQGTLVRWIRSIRPARSFAWARASEDFGSATESLCIITCLACDAMPVATAPSRSARNTSGRVLRPVLSPPAAAMPNLCACCRSSFLAW